jgi:hypothetical protein
LTSLGVAPSAYADAGEVLALLTQSVRRRREDPVLRAELTGLIDDLQTPNAADAGALSVPEVETVDASALARELQSLLSAPPIAGPGGRQRRLAAVMLLASLLLGLLLFPACSQHRDNGNADPFAACEADVSPAHFVNLVDQSNQLTRAQRREAIREFEDLNSNRQETVIAALCRMSAKDIASYLERTFAGVSHARDPVDAQPLYKGVDF